MISYSLPMVLKIKETLDSFNNLKYSFDYDDDNATFVFESNVPTTEDPVLIQIFVGQDDGGDDYISVFSALAINYSQESEDALNMIATFANENVCQHHDYDCEMLVHKREDDAFNLIVRMTHYFDERICNEDNENEFQALMADVIGGALTEFELISPFLVIATTGNENEAHRALIQLQDHFNNAQDRVAGGTSKNPETLVTTTDKFFQVKESAEKGDVDAQIEFAKKLMDIDVINHEEHGDDDPDRSAVYWFKKAAEKGHEEARYLVARCYHDGQGAKRNLEEARKWYKEQIEFSLSQKIKNTDLLKSSINALRELGEPERSTILFPVKYGESIFDSADGIIDQINSNPDALGFFSQCTIFGACFLKRGTLGIDGLFDAASAGSVDAILGLGRLYECGYDFLAKDIDAATTLYKYAYSLKSVDALFSLGYTLFKSLDKKEVGLAMMRKAEEQGSKTASAQLELIKDETKGVSTILFNEISAGEFEFNEMAVAKYLQLYAVDLSDKNAIKSAILDVMTDMKPETFSVIMNEFRVKYLRRRKLIHFTNRDIAERVDFSVMFNELVEEGLVETQNVGDFGIAEDTIYSAKASTQKMKSVTLDWDL